MTSSPPTIDLLAGASRAERTEPLAWTQAGVLVGGAGAQILSPSSRPIDPAS